MSQPAADTSTETSRGRWTALVGWGGLAWLVAFSVYFHSQRLPNNPEYSRRDLWLYLPDLLLIHLPGGSETVSGSEGASASLTIEQQAAHSGWRYLPQRADLMLVGFAIVVGAIGWGSVILRALRISLHGLAERLALAGGVGLSAWSLFTLALGLCGLMSRPLFIAVLLLGVALAVFLLWRDQARPNAPVIQVPVVPWWSHRFFASSMLPLWVLVAVAPFVLAMALGSMLPPTDFDVKEYHLGGPKEFFQNGRITFLPHNVYTSFPFLTEMLSLSAMIVRGDWYRGALAGQLVLMAFAPLSACAIFALARRLAGPLAGWWAVLIHLSTPWVYRISIIAYAEGGLAFYLIASLLAVVMLRDSHGADDSTVKHRVPLLIGFLAGSAASCKYPGLVQVTIPLAMSALWFCWPRSRFGGFRGFSRCAVLVAVGILAAFGPWLVKNIIETGNPVYPLAYRIFGGIDWDAEMDAKWRAGHAASAFKLSSVSEVPADLCRQAVDIAAINDWGSPLLWGFAPIGLLATSTRRKTWGVWLFVAWVFLVWWGLTHRIDRFWVPMIPAVSLLAGIGAAQASSALSSWFTNRRMPGWLSSLLIGFPVAALVLFNLAFATSPLCGYNAYLLDEAYLLDQALAPSIAAIHEAKIDPPPKILLVGEAEIFDARFALRYNTVFDKSLFESWFAAERLDTDPGKRDLRPIDEIRQQLRQEGITHVFVNWSEILRYRRTYGYTDFVTARRFDELASAGLLREIELPGGVIPWDELSAEDQAEVLAWSPELRTDARAFRRWALYEVITDTVVTD